MAEQAAVDLTAAGVVHDLNNVFQTVSEAAYLLSSDPKWSSIAAMLDRSVERGRVIVQCLGEKSTSYGDLGQVVESAIEFAGDVLQALQIPGIEFYRDIQPGIRLRGTPGSWERALLNLFVNAGEAMQQGGIVEVSARRVADQVEITVADNGPGIPEELLPVIFKPNFSTRRRGSGMGLHIVESVVRRNGGRVTASNRCGASGAQFRITVPA
jgi:two-component system, NtrC family, sensor histidine kinase HydH